MAVKPGKFYLYLSPYHRHKVFVTKINKDDDRLCEANIVFKGMEGRTIPFLIEYLLPWTELTSLLYESYEV